MKTTLFCSAMLLILYNLIVAAVVVESTYNSHSTVSNNQLLTFPILKRSGNTRPFSKRDNTNISLYNTNFQFPMVQIGVGTPPQYFNLSIDTGSADVWIPTSSCPVDSCPTDLFDSSKSSSFQSSNSLFKVEYGVGGTVSGKYGNDTIFIGDEFGNVTVIDYTIGLASSVEQGLIYSNAEGTLDGFFGLAYPKVSSKAGKKPTHIASALYQAQIISNPIFSVFLNSQYEFGTSGELTFGGVDDTKHLGEIQYVPVVQYKKQKAGIVALLGNKSNQTGSYYYWSVPGQGVSTTKGYTSPVKLQDFMLDTSSSLSYLPQDIAYAIAKSVGATPPSPEDLFDTSISVDCGLILDVVGQNVTFYISNSANSTSDSPVLISIPVTDLVVPIDGSLTAEEAGFCTFGIQSLGAASPTASDTWILGESVLRSLYSVFDLGNNTVGLAQRSNGSTPTIESTSTLVARAVLSTDSVSQISSSTSTYGTVETSMASLMADQRSVNAMLACSLVCFLMFSVM